MAIAQSTPAKTKKMTVASVLKKIETEKIRWIDLQFVDVLGALQHITIPATSLGNEEFKRGIGKLDGSSIKGFKEIHESDMVMNPDPSTFAVLPWYEGEHRTARFIVDVYEGGSHERFTRDSRYMAQKAAQFAADQGYDTTYWGPEIEFFVFDGIRLLPYADAARNPWSGAGYEIVTREAPWNDSGGKEFPIRFKEGYYPAPPVASLQDFRNEACRVLIESFGMTLDAHHHEVATAGQCEIDMRYDELVPMADNVATYRYVMKMVAHKMGMMATFMPKPIFGDNASGMHVHQSLWTKGKNMMYDPKDEYAEISQTCRYYIGGLMDHARSPDGVDRALADGLHVPEDRLPARPPREVRGAQARRAPADLAAALALRVLPVHGRVSLPGTRERSWPTARSGRPGALLRLAGRDRRRHPVLPRVGRVVPPLDRGPRPRKFRPPRGPLSSRVDDRPAAVRVPRHHDLRPRRPFRPAVLRPRVAKFPLGVDPGSLFDRVGRPAARPVPVGCFRSGVVAHRRDVVRRPDRRDVDMGEAGPAARIADRRSILHRLARPPHHKFRLGVPSPRFHGARVDCPRRRPVGPCPRWLRRLLRPPLCRRFRHARANRFRLPPPTAILASRPRGAVGLRPRRARDSLSDRGRPRTSVRRDRRSSRGAPGGVCGCGSDGIHRVRVPGPRDMASELAATPRSGLLRPRRWLAGSRFRPGPLHGGGPRKHEPMDPRPRLDRPPRIRRVRDPRGHPRDPASVRDGRASALASRRSGS